MSNHPPTFPFDSDYAREYEKEQARKNEERARAIAKAFPELVAEAAKTNPSYGPAAFLEDGDKFVRGLGS